MKKWIVLLVLLAGINGYFIGAGVQIHRHNQDIESLSHRITILADAVEYWRGVARHFQVQAESQEYYNRLHEAEIGRLTKLCERLREERDVYYEVLHDYLNSPSH